MDKIIVTSVSPSFPRDPVQYLVNRYEGKELLERLLKLIVVESE